MMKTVWKKLHMSHQMFMLVPGVQLCNFWVQVVYCLLLYFLLREVNMCLEKKFWMSHEMFMVLTIAQSCNFAY